MQPVRGLVTWQLEASLTVATPRTSAVEFVK